MEPIGSTRGARWLMAAAISILVAGAGPSAATDRAPCGAHESSGTAAPASGTAAPGLRVQVDPKTGAYSMPPPGTLTEPADSDARRASDLVVTPGTSPAGGYKIDLGGAAASHQEQH